MTPEQLRMVVRQELNATASSQRFQFQPIPRHIHNGVDSPPAFEQIRTYTGFVPSDADLTGGSTNGFIYMPNGWTATVSGNVYTVRHNLGNSNYIVLPTMGGPDATACYAGSARGDNVFQVAFINISIPSPAFIPMDFWFTLYHTTNKDPNFTNYSRSTP